MRETMTPKQVQRRYRTIQRKQDFWYLQLKLLQGVCQHPDVTKKYGGNTSNYDPSADSYWIDWRCPDCNMAWRTDQSRENNLKPGRIIK